MPAHQLEAILIRIGLALAAGILAGIVPIALRKARFEPHLGKRIALFLLALFSLVGFGVYGWFLVDRYAPAAPDAPAPITYPSPPPGP
jgi:hypothetical protein